MATALAVTEEDIQTLSTGITFGYQPHRESVGDVVTIMGRYEAARFSNRDGSRLVFRPICGKCRGSGFLPHYAGIHGGLCYDCMGIGLGKIFADGDPVSVLRVLRRREQDKARRDAKRALAEQAKRDAHAQWAAAHPELTAQAKQVRDANDAQAGSFYGLLAELANKAGHSPLTPAQVALFGQLHAEQIAEQQRKAAQAQARRWLGKEGEKITFTAKVIWVGHGTSNFGGYERSNTTYIMVDAHDNSVKWQRSGYFEARKGDVLTVTAKVKKLEESEQHGRCTVVFHGSITNYTQAA